MLGKFICGTNNKNRIKFFWIYCSRLIQREMIVTGRGEIVFKLFIFELQSNELLFSQHSFCMEQRETRSPDRWMPSSPDCAPCDYWLWGYLKKRLNKRKIQTIEGLKKAIREELKNIPPDMTVKALKAWPKRCRMIYYNKGGHIENLKWKRQPIRLQSVN